jgi:hypothetical protein
LADRNFVAVGLTRQQEKSASSGRKGVAALALLRRLAVNFQVTILKVLASYPDGFASIADVKRDVAILATSGRDWSERTTRLAARVPGLEIFAQVRAAGRRLVDHRCRARRPRSGAARVSARRKKLPWRRSASGGSMQSTGRKALWTQRIGSTKRK